MEGSGFKGARLRFGAKDFSGPLPSLMALPPRLTSGSCAGASCFKRSLGTKNAQQSLSKLTAQHHEMLEHGLGDLLWVLGALAIAPQAGPKCGSYSIVRSLF